jgi:hypothetical protein
MLGSRQQTSAIKHQPSNICHRLMSAATGHPSAGNRQKPTDIAPAGAFGQGAPTISAPVDRRAD